MSVSSSSLQTIPIVSMGGCSSMLTPLAGLRSFGRPRQRGMAIHPPSPVKMNLGYCRPPSPYVTGYTINEFLSNETHIDVNERLAKLMNSVKEKLKGETGIEDNDIYQVPVVFERGICWVPDDGVNPKRNCSSKYVIALYPGL